MFAGKTERVIRSLRLAAAGGRRVVAFKHRIDDRYDPDHLVTHRNDRFRAVRVSAAGEILDHSAEAEVVAIDEGQFFKMALVPVVEALLARGVDVIVAGISHDAWGRPFEPIPELSDLAADVVLCQAPCSVCGRPSPFTQRITPSDIQHMVGGCDDYEPRCVHHFEPLPGPPEAR